MCIRDRCNELYMAIPAERRPIVIMDGTYDEMAQSVILDGKDFCVRCLLDEKWLKDGAVRTSCSGPQIREIDGEPEIVRTSGLASSMAANLSAEQYRAAVIGAEEVMNRRITYTAYPHLELSVSHPMRKRDCPGCQIKPPEKIYPLSGSVLNLTLEEALKQIQEVLGTDEFEMAVHALYYKNIVYSGFIVTDVCHACGRPISVMKHEGRTFLEDLRCDSCKEEGKHARYDVRFPSGTMEHAFTMHSMPALQSMKLFDLGYPLGAHIRVIAVSYTHLKEQEKYFELKEEDLDEKEKKFMNQLNELLHENSVDKEIFDLIMEYMLNGKDPEGEEYVDSIEAVSYTHLDVYKRQIYGCVFEEAE